MVSFSLKFSFRPWDADPNNQDKRGRCLTPDPLDLNPVQRNCQTRNQEAQGGGAPTESQVGLAESSRSSPWSLECLAISGNNQHEGAPVKEHLLQDSPELLAWGPSPGAS